MGAAGGDWVPGGFDGDLGFPGLPSLPLACRGWGAPSAPRLRAHSLEASAAVCRAARVSGAPAVADPLLGTLISLQTQTKQKDFLKPVWGEIRRPMD